MKFNFTLLAVLAICASTFAQAPQGINYQAMARNAAGPVIQKPEC